MGFKKLFAYFMILLGVLMEFFAFRLCSKTLCYFFQRCEDELSVECLSSYFLASLILVIGGIYVLSSAKKEEQQDFYS